jgi:hypothetical protein
VTWGVSSNAFNSADYVITTENWPTFRAAILDAAAWAQANGVYEFQLGNEEELHIWRHPVSLVRSANIVTATFTEDHGFTAGNPIDIWNAGPSSFNFHGTITVTGAKTFTYPSAGTNGSVSNPADVFIGNMPEGTIQANLKSVATSVQAIFTRGNVSYSTTGDWFMGEWHSLGRGDIDILAFNAYTNLFTPPHDWTWGLANQVAWFGSDHTYLTEFSLNSGSLDAYSADEAVQAAGTTTMLAAIKAAGITRANFFVYGPDNTYGARKADGTYRELWNILKKANG